MSPNATDLARSIHPQVRIGHVHSTPPRQARGRSWQASLSQVEGSRSGLGPIRSHYLNVKGTEFVRAIWFDRDESLEVWPYATDGSLKMTNEPLDLEALLME